MKRRKFLKSMLGFLALPFAGAVATCVRTPVFAKPIIDYVPMDEEVLVRGLAMDAAQREVSPPVGALMDNVDVRDGMLYARAPGTLTMEMLDDMARLIAAKPARQLALIRPEFKDYIMGLRGQ